MRLISECHSKHVDIPSRVLSPDCIPKGSVAPYDMMIPSKCPEEHVRLRRAPRRSSLKTGNSTRSLDEPKRSISFSEWDNLHLVESFENADDIWYQQQEFVAIQNKCRALIEKQRNGENPEGKLNIRGLESSIDPIERKKKQQSLWRMVSDLQEYQRQKGIRDDGMIQKVCAQISQESAQAAAERGWQDQESITRGARRRTQRRRSCCY
ncbi:MAG: hypothetical protein SGILL_003937 [Bacillariaceae sp.]